VSRQDDLLAPRDFTPNSCPIAQAINALDKPDRPKAEAAIADRRIPRDNILAWFDVNAGLRPSRKAVTNHRGGLCSCRPATTS